MHYLEFLGALAGGLSVWLAIRQHSAYWLLSMFSTSIYTYVLYENKLYADSILHVIYFFIAFYGLYKWRYLGENKQVLKLSWLSNKERFIYSIAIVLIALLSGFAFSSYTDASLPYLDTFCTTASVFGTFLQTHKKVDNWPLWILINTIYIGLFMYKGLYITTALYTFYLFLAFTGFVKWRKSYISQVCTT